MRCRSSGRLSLIHILTSAEATVPPGPARPPSEPWQNAGKDAWLTPICWCSAGATRWKTALTMKGWWQRQANSKTRAAGCMKKSKRQFQTFFCSPTANAPGVRPAPIRMRRAAFRNSFILPWKGMESLSANWLQKQKSIISTVPIPSPISVGSCGIRMADPQFVLFIFALSLFRVRNPFCSKKRIALLIFYSFVFAIKSLRNGFIV